MPVRKKQTTHLKKARAAKKDTSGVFDSVLVHFGDGKARYHPEFVRINRSFVTLPSAWHFKPATEVNLAFQIPSKKGALRKINCHAIIVDCRPMKQKGHYEVDLFVPELLEQYGGLLGNISSPEAPAHQRAEKQRKIAVEDLRPPRPHHLSR